MTINACQKCGADMSTVYTLYAGNLGELRQVAHIELCPECLKPILEQFKPKYRAAVERIP